MFTLLDTAEKQVYSQLSTTKVDIWLIMLSKNNTRRENFTPLSELGYFLMKGRFWKFIPV
jgi:hypothetical protein